MRKITVPWCEQLFFVSNFQISAALNEAAHLRSKKILKFNRRHGASSNKYVMIYRVKTKKGWNDRSLQRYEFVGFNYWFKSCSVNWHAWRQAVSLTGSTKTRNPESGNETESRKRKRKRNQKQKRKRNTESNINDRKLKNFTLHNLVQSKENLS